MPLQPQQEFIRKHLLDDVQELLLTAHRYPEINMAEAVQQIFGWQIARQKLPLWAATEGILYPARISMEQCSSQMAAEYKASIIGTGESMTDLTTGFGVDATIMSHKFRRLNCTEKNEALCAILQNNIPLLGNNHVTISNAEAEEILPELPHQDLIYLDPARRNQYGNKVVAISDCTPDVFQLQDLLLEKADTVLLKLSPMLDLTAISRQLKSVSEIHVVSIEGECKEILVKMQKGSTTTQLFCVNIKANAPMETVRFTADSEQQATCSYADAPSQYLYEPNASIMKAGCFRTISSIYGVKKLSPNSHLYTSQEPIVNFPGRTFRIFATSSLNKKEVRNLLTDIHQANITVRNFPLSVADLRKKLKISEGGDDYLFATTLNNNNKVLILATKEPPSLKTEK